MLVESDVGSSLHYVCFAIFMLPCVDFSNSGDHFSHVCYLVLQAARKPKQPGAFAAREHKRIVRRPPLPSSKNKPTPDGGFRQDDRGRGRKSLTNPRFFILIPTLVIRRQMLLIAHLLLRRTPPTSSTLHPHFMMVCRSK